MLSKDEAVAAARQKIAVKMEKLQALMADLRESNTETKSSMGDKYETGRERLQQEIDTLQMQYFGLQQQFEVLRKLPVKTSAEVGNGTLVATDKGCFLIAVPLGDFAVGNRKIFGISPESPLAKAFRGKQVGETVTLNGNIQTIEQIW